MFTYDKHHAVGELLDAEKQQYAKLVSDQLLGPFDLWGLRFGIETCMDHANGRLVKQDGHGGAGKSDVHMIISSTAHNIGSNVQVRDGGLVIHTDGQDDARSGFGQRVSKQRTGLREVQPRATSRTGGVASTEDPRVNLGNYLDLTRRNSVTFAVVRRRWACSSRV